MVGYSCSWYLHFEGGKFVLWRKFQCKFVIVIEQILKIYMGKMKFPPKFENFLLPNANTNSITANQTHPEKWQVDT